MEPKHQLPIWHHLPANGDGNCPSSMVRLWHLPPELIAMILDRLGDRDFCRCRQATALFRIASMDASIEWRKTRWHGCRHPHDFCATGNSEALDLLVTRGVPFDMRLCVVYALAHGHGDRIIALLRRADTTNVVAEEICDEWRQEACLLAAKHGRVDVLASEWRQHLGHNCIFRGAIEGDSLTTFQWGCAVRGFGPQTGDVCDAVDGGAMSILRYCRQHHGYGRIAWSQLTCALALRATDMDTLFICMGDDTPLYAQKTACQSLCEHMSSRDIETFYVRFPDAFDYQCLCAAAHARNLDVARWLCSHFPDWVDRVVDAIVGVPLCNVINRAPADPRATIKWLCDVDLVSDMSRLARVAAERGDTEILNHLSRRHGAACASTIT